jgi:hypothetical protein
MNFISPTNKSKSPVGTPSNKVLHIVDKKVVVRGGHGKLQGQENRLTADSLILHDERLNSKASVPTTRNLPPFEQRIEEIESVAQWKEQER